MAQIATVTGVVGTVFAIAPDGTVRTLKVGDTLQKGEILRTGPNARVELAMADGAMPAVAGAADGNVAIGSNAIVKVDENMALGEARPTAQEAAVGIQAIQQVLQALEAGGDLNEELEAAAAGLTGGEGAGSDFVQLSRVQLETGSLSYGYDTAESERAELLDTGLDVLPEITLAVVTPPGGGGGGGGALDASGTRLQIEGTGSGDDAVQTITLQLTLSRPSGTAITVDYEWVGGTATAGEDYLVTPRTGTITIPANTTSVQITVGVARDARVEGNETFTLQLSNARGGTLGNASVAITLVDDDIEVAASSVSLDETGGSASAGFGSMSGTLAVNYLGSGTDPVVALSAKDATWDASTATLTENSGVWKLQLAPGATAKDYTYTFTQLKALSHPDTTSPDEPLDIGITATVTTSVVVAGVTYPSEDTTAFTVTVRDDGPTARDDVGGLVVEDREGATILGGTGTTVLSNDTAGADSPLAFAGWDDAANAAAVDTLNRYGKVSLFDDGRWGYSLDNFLPATQALDATYDETFSLSYFITDADGDRATAVLTIRVQGAADAASVVVSAGSADALVLEAGLTSAADTSETDSGSFAISASDGLSVVTVGGLSLTLAELLSLSAATPSAGFDTGKGVLTLTGYTGDRFGGDVAFSYTLSGPLDHRSSGDGITLTDAVEVSVVGIGGTSASGTLRVDVIDDLPTTRPTPTVTVGEGDRTFAGGVFSTAAGKVGTFPLVPDPEPTPRAEPFAARSLAFSARSFAAPLDLAPEPEPAADVNAPLALAGADGGRITELNADGVTGLTSGGEPVVFTSTTSADGGTITLTATAGDTVVLVVDMDTVTGDFNVTLLGTLDHSLVNESGEADPLNLVLNYTVTDGDGDTANGTFTVSVLDDAPTVQASAGVTLDEADLRIPESASTVTVGKLVSFSEVPVVSGGTLANVSGSTETVALAGARLRVVDPATDAQLVKVTNRTDQAVEFDWRDSIGNSYAQGLVASGEVIFLANDSYGGNVALQLFVRWPGDTEWEGRNRGTLADPASDSVDFVFPASTEATALSGQIDFNAGADGGRITALSADALEGLTAGGEAVVFTSTTSADGGTITLAGTAGGKAVFTVEVNTATGAYTATLLGPLDHALANESGEADPLNLALGFTVTDGDGDTVTGTFTVTVLDDAPVARADTATQVAENAPISTNVLTNDRAGADGATLQNAVLRAGAGTLAFDADGQITYTPSGAETGVVLIDYTVTDGDGDTSTATLSITLLADSAPSIVLDADGGEAKEVFESGLVTGSGSASGSGSGIDTLSGTLAIPTGEDTLASLVVNGQNLVMGGSVDTASGLFSVSLGTDGTYTWTYTLLQATAEGSTDIETISLLATDSDGSEAALTFTIRIVDDVPVLVNDLGSVAEGAVLEVATGAGVLANDTPGADGPLAVVGVVAGVAVAGTAAAANALVGTAVAGQYGTLVLNADGGYRYEATANAITADAQDIFTYTVSDADGDLVSTTLTINVANNTPPTVVLPPVELTVNEAGLPGGSDASSNSETTTGSVRLNVSDNVTSLTVGGVVFTPASLLAFASTGTPAKVETDIGTLQVTGATAVREGGVLTAVDLTYSYTLKAAQTHTGPGADSSVRDVLDVEVQYANGGKGSSQPVVSIVDDVPQVLAKPTVVLDEAGLVDAPGTSPAVAEGRILFEPGADGAVITALNVQAPSGLTSNGLEVTFTRTEGTTAAGEATITLLGSTVDRDVLRVEVNASTGAYTTTLLGPLDHPNKRAAGADDEIGIRLGYTVTDGDGDEAAGVFDIRVQDDAPSTGSFTVEATPENTVLLSDGSFEINFNYFTAARVGGDGVDTVSVRGPNPVPGTDSVFTLRGSGFDSTSGEGSVQLAVGSFGRATLTFTLIDVDGDPTGSATVTLIVPRGLGEVPAATDTVGVVEEAALNASATLAEGSNAARTSETFSGKLNLQAGWTVEPTSGNTANGSYAITADGGFRYTLTAAIVNAPGADAATDTFNYTAVNAWGRTVTNTVTMTVKDDGPQALASESVTLQEPGVPLPVGAVDLGKLLAFNEVKVQVGAGLTDVVGSLLTLDGLAVVDPTTRNQMVQVKNPTDETLEFEWRDSRATVPTLYASGTVGSGEVLFLSITEYVAVEPTIVLFVKPVGSGEFVPAGKGRGTVTDANPVVKNFEVGNNTPAPGSSAGSGGTDFTAVVAAGTLNFEAGADGGRITALSASELGELSAGGKPVVFEQTFPLSASGEPSGFIILTGIAGGKPVLTVEVNTATGDYEATLLAPLDHAAPDAPGATPPLELDFGYTVTDGDRDEASGTFKVTVLDQDGSVTPPPPAGEVALATANGDDLPATVGADVFRWTLADSIDLGAAVDKATGELPGDSILDFGASGTDVLDLSDLLSQPGAEVLVAQDSSNTEVTVTGTQGGDPYSQTIILINYVDGASGTLIKTALEETGIYKAE